MRWYHRFLQMNDAASEIFFTRFNKLEQIWFGGQMSKVGRNRWHNRDLKPVSLVLHKSVLHSVNSNWP